MLCPQLCALPHALRHQADCADLRHCALAQQPAALSQPAAGDSAARPATAPAPAAVLQRAQVAADAFEAGAAGERIMRHQERFVLRPVPQRGYHDADVKASLDVGEIRAELVRDAPGAVRLALGNASSRAVTVVPWPAAVRRFLDYWLSPSAAGCQPLLIVATLAAWHSWQHHSLCCYLIRMSAVHDAWHACAGCAGCAGARLSMRTNQQPFKQHGHTADS
jgi:hypothetical protein